MVEALPEVYWRRYGTSTFYKLDDIIGVSYDDLTLDFTIPEFSVEMDNKNGRYSSYFDRSDEIQIRRNGVLVFYGKVIDPPTSKTTSDVTLTLNGQQFYYARAKEVLAINALKQRGYNPWKYGRVENTTDGTTKSGVTPMQLFKAALGTRLVMQYFFNNWNIRNDNFRTFLDSNALRLTRISETVFWDAGYFTTRVISNGEPTIAHLKNIGALTLTIFGAQPTNTSLTVTFYRDGGTSGVTKTGTFSAGFWTFNVASSDWPVTTEKRELVLKFNLTSVDGVSTPQIQYFVVDADATLSGTGDTDIGEGTIDTFTNPNGPDSTMGGEWNFQPRLAVLHDVATSLPSDTAEVYPAWFGFIDMNGLAHLRNPTNYGRDMTAYPLSFGESRLRLIQKDVDGSIINKLIHMGTGIPALGGGQLTTVVSDNASIAKYGEVQGTYLDKAVSSVTQAGLRANMILKLKKSPIIALSIEAASTFNFPYQVGDKVKVDDPELDISDVMRVLKVSHAFQVGSEEEITMEVSNKLMKFKSFIGQIADKVEDQALVAQGSTSPPQISFADNIDKDNPAILSFWIPSNKKVNRIFLYCKSSQFRTYEQTSAAESAHTHGMAHTHGVPAASHGHTVDVSLGGGHTHTVSGSSANDGGLLWAVGTKDHLNYTAPAGSYPTADTLTISGSILSQDVEYMIVRFEVAGANNKDVAWRLWVNNSYLVSSDWAASLDDNITTSKVYVVGGTQLYNYLGSGVTISTVTYQVQAEGSSENVNLHIEAHVYKKHSHGAGTLSGGSNTHTHPSQAAATTTPASTTSNSQSASTSNSGSSHTHGQNYGIFKYSQYPASVQMYVRNYPLTGNNPDENTLVAPFVEFGTRGTESTGFEIISMDISQAFVDSSNTFFTGLQTLYFKSTASTNNPSGLGRIIANVFVELQDDTQARTLV